MLENLVATIQPKSTHTKSLFKQGAVVKYQFVRRYFNDTARHFRSSVLAWQRSIK